VFGFGKVPEWHSQALPWPNQHHWRKVSSTLKPEEAQQRQQEAQQHQQEAQQRQQEARRAP